MDKKLTRVEKITLSVAAVTAGAITVGGLVLYSRFLGTLNDQMAAHLDRIAEPILEQIAKK